MTTPQTKQQNKQYIDCDKCSMQAVCEPISESGQAINLADNYLSKRVALKSGEVLFSENEPLSAFSTLR